MLDPDRRKSYGVTSAILAWLVLFSYVASFITSATFKRMMSETAAEDYSPEWHISFGLLALVLVVLRLWWWLKNQRPVAPKKMSDKTYGFSRLTLLLMYLNVLQLSLTGVLSGWAKGYTVGLFGLFSWPELDATFSAYAAVSHQWSWQINCGVLAVYCLINGYFGIRYKVGFRRLLPGVHV